MSITKSGWEGTALALWSNPHVETPTSLDRTFHRSRGTPFGQQRTGAAVREATTQKDAEESGTGGGIISVENPCYDL